MQLDLFETQPDPTDIMNTCQLVSSNGIWAGEKQFTYQNEEYYYYINKRKDGTFYLSGQSKRYSK